MLSGMKCRCFELWTAVVTLIAHLSDTFCLGQVEPAVQKGTQGELALPCQPCPSLQAALQMGAAGGGRATASIYDEQHTHTHNRFRPRSPGRSMRCLQPEPGGVA